MHISLLKIFSTSKFEIIPGVQRTLVIVILILLLASVTAAVQILLLLETLYSEQMYHNAVWDPVP